MSARYAAPGAPPPEAAVHLEAEQGPRPLRGPIAWFATAVAAGMSLFHLYGGGFGAQIDLRQRSAHLAFALALVFLHFPPHTRLKDSRIALAVDLVLGAVAVAAAAYPFIFYEEMIMRVGAPSALDLTFGVVLIVLVLEATRRSISWMLTIICAVFLVYAFLPGDLLPNIISHRDYSLRRIVDQMYMATEGIFGIPLGVSATYVFLFVFFGAALESLRAGQFLIDMSVALMGRYRGGPAKAAVVASGAMGTISGSSIANTVTTGVITIPLMRKIGFPRENAGAVEVAASTNGQLVPPVMGAAAFIMAETIGIPYGDVVKAAIVPAALSYTAIFTIVHLDALKLGLGAMKKEEVPPALFTFLRGLHYLIPLALLLYYLFSGRTPMLAAFYSIVAALTLLLLEIPIQRLYNLIAFRPEMRFGPDEFRPFTDILRRFGQTFVAGARNMIGIAVACASCGIIIGVISLTGLAGQISDIIVSLSGGQFFPMLAISAVVAIVMGMGLPTTATYIIMAAMVAPAVMTGAAEAGVVLPVIAVHMFVFYYGILADDTPPVGLCAYAAAGISGADPIRTGLKSFQLDLAAFLLPFMFVYNTELLLIDVDLITFIPMIGLAVVGMISLSGAIKGYLAGPVPWWGRFLLLASAFLLVKPGWFTGILGLALLGGVFYLSRVRKREKVAGIQNAAGEP